MVGSVATESGVSINSGGRVFKIGHVVVVNMEFTTTVTIAAWAKIMTNFPIRNPASSFYITCLDTANANKVYRIYLNGDGSLRTRDNLPAGVYNIDFVYTAK